MVAGNGTQLTAVQETFSKPQMFHGQAVVDKLLQ